MAGQHPENLSVLSGNLWVFLSAMITAADSIIYEFDRFRIDSGKRLLFDGGGDPIPLTPKVFDTLLYLVSHSDKVIGKDELMAAIWPDTIVEENNLNKNISILRQILGENPGDHRYIVTVPGTGYKFVAKVHEVYGKDVEEQTKTHDRSDMLPSYEVERRGNVLALADWKNNDRDSDEEASLSLAPTAKRKRWLPLFVAGVVGVALLAVGYVFVSSFSVREGPNDQTKASPKLYWDLTESEKNVFVEERTKHIHYFIGDNYAHLDDRSLGTIRGQLEWYVSRRDSLSQEPFKEGLRLIYGRASQYSPLIHAEFEKTRVPPMIGIYQAMVESEYRDCLVADSGPIGLFQFTKRTALKYGMLPEDRCNVDQQALAAARYMSDLLSDFGEPQSSWTLALLSFDQGEEGTRQQLRELRSTGVTERTYWAILQNPDKLSYASDPAIRNYVPRFFAAAIIGETPEAFDLATPPLSTIRSR